MTEVCRAFGISRKTGYKWLQLYNEKGKAALKDRSRAPLSRTRNTPKDVEAAILGLQRRHPRFGAKKLKSILETDHSELAWPSLTTFNNILKRNGCTSARHKRSRLASASPLQESKAPNDVWTADFKGWWRVKDGSICEPFTLCDSHSRFVLCCSHVKTRNFDTVWCHLVAAFQEHGMPLRFRTDNGSPFASVSIGRLSKLSIRLIRLGITPEWITPGRPQQNGRHERMHRSLKREAVSPPAASLVKQEEALNLWMYTFNFARPHEGLNMATPGQVYLPSSRPWTGEECDPTYPDSYQQRKVDTSGYVYWKGLKIFTSELLRRQILGFSEQEGGLIEIYFGAILLGTIDPLTGFKKA